MSEARRQLGCGCFRERHGVADLPSSTICSFANALRVPTNSRQDTLPTSLPRLRSDSPLYFFPFFFFFPAAPFTGVLVPLPGPPTLSLTLSVNPPMAACTCPVTSSSLSAVGVPTSGIVGRGFRTFDIWERSRRFSSSKRLRMMEEKDLYRIHWG